MPACRLSILTGLILCLLSSSVSAQDQTLVRRAAFDIGSAAIKCTVADVDTATGNIIRVLEELSHKVDFAEDLARSYDGNLSKNVMDKGIAVIEEMKQVALNRQATAFAGVGGSSFRTARNGRAYFVRIKDETGVNCRVTSVQQAAMLSYHAVQQALKDTSRNILVWDIGGSSTQMTARDIQGGLVFHIDPMASISFKNVVIGAIQEHDVSTVSSPNPISAADVKRALDYAQSYAIMNIPPPLINRIKASHVRVVGIGGVHYYSVPATLGDHKKIYTLAEVETALIKWTDKPDEAFESEYASTRLTNLILVLGYMRALHLEEVQPLKINEADGLLAAPEFW